MNILPEESKHKKNSIGAKKMFLLLKNLFGESENGTWIGGRDKNATHVKQMHSYKELFTLLILLLCRKSSLRGRKAMITDYNCLNITLKTY